MTHGRHSQRVVKTLYVRRPDRENKFVRKPHAHENKVIGGGGKGDVGRRINLVEDLLRANGTRVLGDSWTSKIPCSPRVS